MLKTASDFENSIAFLITGMAEEQNRGLKYQTKNLDSDDFNSTFEVIESRLNKLYEKTRVMEDVISYTKAYLEQNIYDTTKECRAIMSTLEDNRDKLKTNSYISYTVPVLEGSGSYLDRDNTQLAHCSVNNSVLTISGKAQIDIPIKSMERKKGQVPYKSSLEGLLEGKVYRAFYLLDGPVTNGLRENIYVELQTPTAINFIDITPSNCKIENIQYIDETGNIEYEDNFMSVITRERKIKAIQLILSSTLYKTSTYYIDQSRMASNFWDTIKEAEYNNAMGGNVDLSNVDAAAGIDSFRTAYKAYVAALQSWKTRRAAVASANNANGYSDSVPYTDFLLAPDVLNASDRVNISPFNANYVPSAEQNLRYTSGVSE